MNSEQSPLETALDAQRPIATDRQELEIELLIPKDKRRITASDHERWRLTGRPPHEGDADIQE